MKGLLCLVFLSFSIFGQAQRLTLSPSYGVGFAAGDLSDRYGTAFGLGAEAEYYFSEKWSINLAYRFEFGSTVKEDVLSGLRDDSGMIVGSDDELAEIYLRRRGQYIGTNLYRHFRLSNSSYSVALGLGAGYWKHKIRIVDESKSVAQADKQFDPLYDRLTAGPAATQSIALRKISIENRFNFYIALEVMEGFTTNQRDFNLPDLLPDPSTRLDIQWGFRAGWVIPIGLGGNKVAKSKKQKDEEIYY